MKRVIEHLRERLADVVLGGWILDVREVARVTTLACDVGWTRALTVTLVEHRLRRARWPWGGARFSRAHVRAATPVRFERGEPLVEAVFDDVDHATDAVDRFVDLVRERRAAARWGSYGDA